MFCSILKQMRVPLFLLALAPLVVWAGCPAILDGLDLNSTAFTATCYKTSSAASKSMKDYDINDAVDVACGRSNYTSAFWSNAFVQHMILYVVVDELNKNGTELKGFKPLSQSIKKEYAELQDVKAKAYVDAFFAHQRKTRRRRMTAARLVKEIMALMSLNFSHVLPIKSQIALAQATKSAFGVVEIDEMRQARIDTAMSAIERLGVATRNERLAELFPQIYDLAMKNFTMGKSAFEGFANELENAWTNSTTISHLEIVPAIETLYVQYNSLSNTDAKAYVDWFLAMMASAASKSVECENEDTANIRVQATHKFAEKRFCLQGNYFSIVDRDPLCFKELSRDTQAELRSAFPEVFAYIDTKFSMEKWVSGATVNNSEKKMNEDQDGISIIEGSGEF